MTGVVRVPVSVFISRTGVALKLAFEAVDGNGFMMVPPCVVVERIGDVLVTAVVIGNVVLAVSLVVDCIGSIVTAEM